MHEEFTHRDALAALSARELSELKETRDVPGLLHLAGHALLLCLTGSLVLWAADPALKILAMTLHGIAFVSLFALEHETIHGTAFRTPWLNAIIAEACGFLLLLPPRHFRFFHFAHHRHTQDPANDPELASPKPSDWRGYLWHLSGIPYWRAEISVLINNARGRQLPDFVPANARAKLVLEARLHLAAMAALAIAGIAFSWSWILTLWVVPALLGQPFLRAYLMAEHGACPLVANMLANSRTTYTNRLVRFLAWNMPFHSAHHALPTVPFHRLPALNGNLAARLQKTANGYGEAHRQIRAAWATSSAAGRSTP
ncbi:MAG: fatty acid desaturase [Rhizobiales bacterium]|nr:fatty acid desaturase [Hyphomicrobiales bacterium]